MLFYFYFIFWQAFVLLIDIALEEQNYRSKITSCEWQCALIRGVNKPSLILSPLLYCFIEEFQCMCRFLVQYGALLLLRLDNNKEQKLILVAATME